MSFSKPARALDDMEAQDSSFPQQHAEDQKPALTDTLSLAHHDVKSRAESISAKVRTEPASKQAGSQHLLSQHARAHCHPACGRH